MSSEKEWTAEEAIAHGREWLAVGWVWEPGQACCLGDGAAYTKAPDMRNPGTRGHALAQVREAWDNPRLFVEWVGDGWRVMGGTLGAVATTESEALLAARRAAEQMDAAMQRIRQQHPADPVSSNEDEAAQWSAAEMAAWTWLAAQRGTIGGWVGFTAWVMEFGCESLRRRGYLESRRDPQLGPGLFYRPCPEQALDVARSMATHLATVHGWAPIPPC
jgi:hypothetical protein